MTDSAQHSPSQIINTAFWNVQNLFDPDISGLATEFEYTAVSGWDRRAVQSRLTRLAQVIMSMFDGRGPDLLGLAEIENERLADRLLRETGRDDLALVTPEGDGLAACNTMLMYSTRTLELAGSPQTWIVDTQYPVCDILEIPLRVKQNDAELTVLVNDWPGRRSGPEGLRHAVATHCGRIVTRHLKLHRSEYLHLGQTDSSCVRLNQRWNRNLLLMGDFSDEPWDSSLRQILHADYSDHRLSPVVPGTADRLPSWKTYAAVAPVLFNPTWTALNGPDSGTTVCRTGCTSSSVLFDQIIVSGGVRRGTAGLRIVPPYSTDSPDRLVKIFRPDIMCSTDGLPIPYNCETRSGYSDHFPVVTSLEIANTDDA